MKFGYFDDENKEYVITTPKTPYPWINYLGCENFFSLVSNTAGGYCFYKDARMRRIMRYRYNNIPVDSNGRYYYIKDGDEIWNPGWMPTKAKLDFYECRHGLGYTKFKSSKNNIEVNQLMFVPLNYNGEIHQIKIKNLENKEKNISLFSYIEFCLWEANDDMTNFQRNLSTGEVEIEGSTIYHKTEYRERRDHYSFYSVNTKINGFDTDRDTFIGMYNGLDTPNNVLRGEASNSIASGWCPIGSHQINLNLKSGEEKNLIFIIGYVENNEDEKFIAPGVINKEKAINMQKQFCNDEDVNSAFNELGSYWNTY